MYLQQMGIQDIHLTMAPSTEASARATGPGCLFYVYAHLQQVEIQGIHPTMVSVPGETLAVCGTSH